VLALLGPQPGGHATLAGPDGTRLAITVAPHQTVLHQTVLSTSEAAGLLDQMVTDSEDAGLYDLPGGVPRTGLTR